MSERPYPFRIFRNCLEISANFLKIWSNPGIWFAILYTSIIKNSPRSSEELVRRHVEKVALRGAAWWMPAALREVVNSMTWITFGIGIDAFGGKLELKSQFAGAV